MDISLLHAGLAAGAALAAIPVILHLFMRQKPKHVIFPALRLIRERQKRAKKKLRIKNWLLLLARMAVVALMALALARPAINAQTSLGDREVPTALALVFDTSLSMEYTERNETRLAEAKKRAGDILKKTPATSQVFVIDSAEPAAPHALSPASAQKQIDGLVTHASNRPLNAALGQAYRAVAESDRPRREVYVLTDLARSSWELGRPVDGLDAIRKVKPPVSTYVLRLTPKDAHDVAVVEARPSAGVAARGEPVAVTVKLRGSGEAADRIVEFYVDRDAKGNPIKRDQKRVAVKAHGEAEVEFRTPANLAIGPHQGEVHLAGTDPLAFDDRRYFSFQVRPPLKVLVVADPDRQSRADAEFVIEALDPLTQRSSPSRPFRVDWQSTRQFTGRPREALKDYACLFLLNVKQLEESEWNRLFSFVREGSGLVIALGDRVSPENYNSPIAAQVVPALVEKASGSPKDPLSFGRFVVDHPLFQRYAKDLAVWMPAIPVFRYWAVTPAKGTRTLLSFENNAPALLERTYQGAKSGRVLLWTTPLARDPEHTERNWNDLPAFWPFLALMDQTVSYLAGLAGEQLNYEAGHDVVLPIDPTKRIATYVVQGPDPKTSYPLSPPVSTAQLLIPTPPTIGQWTVTPTGAGSKEPAIGFSVNPPVEETEITPLATRDLDNLFGKGKYALAEDPDSLDHTVGKVRVGRELFPWLMALILVIVTLENLLANRFYREQPAASRG